jgi:hypothetical protein
MVADSSRLTPFEGVVAGLGDEEFTSDIGATAVVNAGEDSDQAFAHKARKAYFRDGDAAFVEGRVEHVAILGVDECRTRIGPVRFVEQSQQFEGSLELIIVGQARLANRYRTGALALRLCLFFLLRVFLRYRHWPGSSADFRDVDQLLAPVERVLVDGEAAFTHKTRHGRVANAKYVLGFFQRDEFSIFHHATPKLCNMKQSSSSYNTTARFAMRQVTMIVAYWRFG